MRGSVGVDVTKGMEEKVKRTIGEKNREGSEQGGGEEDVNLRNKGRMQSRLSEGKGKLRKRNR